MACPGIAHSQLLHLDYKVFHQYLKVRPNVNYHAAKPPGLKHEQSHIFLLVLQLKVTDPTIPGIPQYVKVTKEGSKYLGIHSTCQQVFTCAIGTIDIL